MSCTSRKSTTVVDHSGNYLNLLDADALKKTQAQINEQNKRPGTSLKKVKPYEPTESGWSGFKPTIDVLLHSSSALVTKISPNTRRRDGLSYIQVSENSTPPRQTSAKPAEAADSDESFNGLEPGLAEYMRMSARASRSAASMARNSRVPMSATSMRRRPVKATAKAEHERKEFIKAAPKPEDLFTKEQIQEYRRAFDLFDSNKDNIITTREALTVIRSLGQDPSMEEIQKMMDTLDIDGNGTVDFDEFITVIAKLMEDEPTEADLVDIFRVMDQDGDGYISIGDLRDINNRLQINLTTMELEEMFQEVDQDGDRRCDFEEFMKIIRTKC